MVTFFFLAGASLRWDAATAAGWLVVAYVLLRVLGRVVGGFVGARFCSIEPLHARWMGPALLPQAGVALGMTIVATERVPDVAATLVPVVVAATMIFELIGPIVTKVALRATREIPN